MKYHTEIHTHPYKNLQLQYYTAHLLEHVQEPRRHVDIDARIGPYYYLIHINQLREVKKTHTAG